MLPSDSGRGRGTSKQEGQSLNRGLSPQFLTLTHFYRLNTLPVTHATASKQEAPGLLNRALKQDMKSFGLSCEDDQDEWRMRIRQQLANPGYLENGT